MVCSTHFIYIFTLLYHKRRLLETRFSPTHRNWWGRNGGVGGVCWQDTLVWVHSGEIQYNLRLCVGSWRVLCSRLEWLPYCCCDGQLLVALQASVRLRRSRWKCSHLYTTALQVNISIINMHNNTFTDCQFELYYTSIDRIHQIELIFFACF